MNKELLAKIEGQMVVSILSGESRVIYYLDEADSLEDLEIISEYFRKEGYRVLIDINSSGIIRLVIDFNFERID